MDGERGEARRGPISRGEGAEARADWPRRAAGHAHRAGGRGATRAARIGRGQDTVPVARVSRGRRATAASTATPAATEQRENASAEAELVISVVSAPALATTRQITQITHALHTPRAYPAATRSRIVTVRRACVPRPFVPTDFRVKRSKLDSRKEEETGVQELEERRRRDWRGTVKRS